MSWRELARCMYVDPTLFDPLDAGMTPDGKSTATAILICQSCKVTAECLAEQARTQSLGVWGGRYFGINRGDRKK